MMKSVLAGAVALILATPVFADIEVVDAYARAASPTAKAGAAFMVIRNTGSEGDRLIAAASDIAFRAALSWSFRVTSAPSSARLTASACCARAFARPPSSRIRRTPYS